jgi:hypothetical protein
VLLLQRAEFAVALDDYKFKGIWMNSNKILCAIALGSFIGGVAHARGIQVDGWQSVSSGNGLTANVGNDPPLGPTLAGIQSLSFSSGTSLPGFSVATFTEGGPEFFAVRYEWDAVGGGLEQVVINNTETPNGNNGFDPTGQFSVTFGYSFGTDDLGNANGSTTAGNLPEVASLSVNGVTYTTTVAPNSLNGTDALNSHDDSIFKFSNGVLTNAADIARGWSSSTTVSAPEINPSSAASALTFLMGCLAVLGSRSKGRKSESGSI